MGDDWTLEAVIVVILLALALFLVTSIVFMWAWNITMPSWFGLPELTPFQAVAVLILLLLIRVLLS